MRRRATVTVYRCQCMGRAWKTRNAHQSKVQQTISMMDIAAVHPANVTTCCWRFRIIRNLYTCLILYSCMRRNFRQIFQCHPNATEIEFSFPILLARSWTVRANTKKALKSQNKAKNRVMHAFVWGWQQTHTHCRSDIGICVKRTRLKICGIIRTKKY